MMYWPLPIKNCLPAYALFLFVTTPIHTQVEKARFSLGQPLGHPWLRSKSRGRSTTRVELPGHYRFDVFPYPSTHEHLRRVQEHQDRAPTKVSGSKSKSDYHNNNITMETEEVHSGAEERGVEVSSCFMGIVPLVPNQYSLPSVFKKSLAPAN
jgi:hypothetical protein